MSRSLVEKYEHMLSQDPTSTVFVELARAYIERGDNEAAVAICTKGCGHHPTSVVGRVLWGKALITLGKAAEAMSQFDKAMAIDMRQFHETFFEESFEWLTVMEAELLRLERTACASRVNRSKCRR